MEGLWVKSGGLTCSSALESTVACESRGLTAPTGLVSLTDAIIADVDMQSIKTWRAFGFKSGGLTCSSALESTEACESRGLTARDPTRLCNLIKFS